MAASRPATEAGCGSQAACWLCKLYCDTASPARHSWWSEAVEQLRAVEAEAAAAVYREHLEEPLAQVDGRAGGADSMSCTASCVGHVSLVLHI